MKRLIQQTKEFLGLLKRLKHRGKTLKVCPICGSTNIRLSSKFDGWLTPIQYVCKDCGYKGPIILELEEEENWGNA